MPSPAPQIAPWKSAQIARDLRWTRGSSPPGQPETSPLAFVQSISLHPASRTDTPQFDSPRSPRYQPAPFAAASPAAASLALPATPRDTQIRARTPENTQGT